MSQKIDHNPTFARIQALHDAGTSLRDIAEILESEGFPQIGKREKWNHSAVDWCLNQRGRSPAKTAASPPVSEPKPPSGPPPPPQTAPSADPPPPTAPPAAPKPAPKSDTIDVHGPYTVEDRRLWGLLLRLATRDLDPGAFHQMSVSSVLDALRMDQEQLTSGLDRLICTSIKWVALRPPGLMVWAPLLASVTLSGNFLSFHFAPHLIKLLRDDKEYTRIQAALEEKENQAPAQALVFSS